MKDEGWRAFYKGLLPGLFLVRFGIVISVQHAMRYVCLFCVSLFKFLLLVLFLKQVTHGAIQFAAYEELRKLIVDFRRKQNSLDDKRSDSLVSSSAE